MRFMQATAQSLHAPENYIRGILGITAERPHGFMKALIDLQGYEKWVEGNLQHLASGFGLRNRSRSTSTIAESAAESD